MLRFPTALQQPGAGGSGTGHGGMGSLTPDSTAKHPCGSRHPSLSSPSPPSPCGCGAVAGSCGRGCFSALAHLLFLYTLWG